MHSQFKRTTAALRRRWSAISRRAIVILVYHRITTDVGDAHNLAVSPKRFAEQLEVLRRWGQPIRARDLPGILRQRKLPRRGYVVTFDDGYVDNLTNAKPLLQKCETPATVFAASAFAPGGREYWWIALDTILESARREKRNLHVKEGEITTSTRSWFETALSGTSPAGVAEALKALRLQGTGCHPSVDSAPMTEDQLHALTADGLIDIGAHSINHRRLALLSEDDQREEISGAKHHLEEVLGRSVDTFAYPFGVEGSDYTRRTQELVKEAGFACAFSVRSFPLVGYCDPYALPRCWVSDWDGDEFSRRLRFWYTR